MNLFFIVFLIELLFYHLAGKGLFADAYLDGSLQGTVACVDECHAHALVYRKAMVSCGYSADFFTFYLDGIACTGYGSVEELDAYYLLFQSEGFLLGESILADKLLLVEFHKDA